MPFKHNGRPGLVVSLRTHVYEALPSLDGLWLLQRGKLRL